MKYVLVLSMSLGLICVRPLIQNILFLFLFVQSFKRWRGMIFFGTRVIPGSRVISFNFFLRGGGEFRVQGSVKLLGYARYGHFYSH